MISIYSLYVCVKATLHCVPERDLGMSSSVSAWCGCVRQFSNSLIHSLPLFLALVFAESDEHPSKVSPRSSNVLEFSTLHRRFQARHTMTMVVVRCGMSANASCGCEEQRQHAITRVDYIHNANLPSRAMPSHPPSHGHAKTSSLWTNVSLELVTRHDRDTTTQAWAHAVLQA